MGIIDRLATSLNRTDQVSNQELAQKIAEKGDKKAVKELVDNLTNLDSNLQGDCIKVLDEIGERKPALIADHGNEFLALLASENNRLVWGAMTALDAITLERPASIYRALPTIIDIANKGSVITKDHGVSILIKLVSIKRYEEEAFALLVQQLRGCPTNQLPMYAERAMPVINDQNKAVFIKTLTSRLGSIKKETKRKRVEKVIERLSAR